MPDNPVETALGLTVIVAASLLVGGILRIVLSINERFDGRRRTLLNGVISFLGVGIWRQWPFSGLGVIGFCLGMEMLLSGLSWMMLGLVMRSGARFGGVV